MRSVIRFVLPAAMLLAVSWSVPEPLAANCMYCRQAGGTTFKCDAGQGSMKCKGIAFGLCAGCANVEGGVVALPVSITPSGSLTALGATWAIDVPWLASLSDPAARSRAAVPYMTCEPEEASPDEARARTRILVI